jgi:tRNA pseudouridine38-40 synthase
MRNIKLVLSYDGTDFNGWQIQPGLRTVQETLELAAEQITGVRPKANASGRTDAGVHAVGQVVNFRTNSPMTPASFIKALNVKLPEDVSVRACEEVPESFDANRDAIRKMYRATTNWMWPRCIVPPK